MDGTRKWITTPSQNLTCLAWKVKLLQLYKFRIWKVQVGINI